MEDIACSSLISQVRLVNNVGMLQENKHQYYVTMQLKVLLVDGIVGQLSLVSLPSKHLI